VVLRRCSAPPQARRGKSVTHEVAQDDGHALANLAECVCNGNADLVERNVRSPSCRRVRCFDRLRRHVVVPWDQDRRVPAAALALYTLRSVDAKDGEVAAHLRAAAGREVVREHAVRNPLLCAGDHPFVAVTHRRRLQAGNIAP
jgi:hypothetical protein